MASKSVVEDFTGSGTLAGTSPASKTGVSSATWATYTGTSTPINAYTRGPGGASVVLPLSALARLDFGSLDLTHSSGVFTVQATVRPGMQLRVAFDLDECQISLGANPDGSGSWSFDGLSSSSSNTFTGSAAGASMVLRIEFTTTQTRLYVDNTLKATYAEGFYSGIVCTSVRLSPLATFANGAANGTTVTAARDLQILTETTSGPLGPAGVSGRISAEHPLGIAQVSSPLGAARALIEHDWTGLLAQGGAVEFYVCDLIDAGAVVARVPISSWQGTARLEGASYLQAVVPAVADLIDTIAGLSESAEFAISRGARLPSGETVLSEMARSAIDEVQLDQGPQRYTCTLSGYSAAIGEPITSTPPARTLRGVRSISSSSSGVRVRCEVDWFLKPGAPAVAGSITLVPTYISFFVGGNDAYMDAGQQGA